MSIKVRVLKLERKQENNSQLRPVILAFDEAGDEGEAYLARWALEHGKLPEDAIIILIVTLTKES
jgi:hypothetical protein